MIKGFGIFIRKGSSKEAIRRNLLTYMAEEVATEGLPDQENPGFHCASTRSPNPNLEQDDFHDEHRT